LTAKRQKNRISNIVIRLTDKSEDEMKKIDIEDAVGKVLAYDVTEVNKEKKIKRRAYKRGYIIKLEDIEHFKSLGRKTIFIEEGELKGVHEDDAAKIVAPLAAGKNIEFDEEPSEGKIGFRSETDGVFKIDKDRLTEINKLKIPSMPTIHNNFPVTKGKGVAAFRIIPLVCDEEIIKKIKDILKKPLMEVVPYKIKNAALLVTGSEVYEGKIKDGFEPVIKAKLKKFGCELVEKRIVPDEFEIIKTSVQELAEKAEFVITTGGTSVDPDDITAEALKQAGVQYEVKGTPIQPGNNFTIGRLGDVPVCAVPAAAIHFRATALDIMMPRILAGETITAEEIAEQAYGGLCHFCDKCVFPVCPFGRP